MAALDAVAVAAFAVLLTAYVTVRQMVRGQRANHASVERVVVAVADVSVPNLARLIAGRAGASERALMRSGDLRGVEAQVAGAVDARLRVLQNAW